MQHIYHYLDDFIVLSSPGTEECEAYLSILQRVCQDLGVPLAPEKQDGPAEVLNFLGIEIDNIKQELRLPTEKLQRLLRMVDEWENQKACTRRELESLIGTLQHTCKVIRPGRSFLRGVISLLSITKQPHAEFRSDIRWWKAFAAVWNGAAILTIPEQDCLSLVSDASGSWGCGAWHATHWFQLEWSTITQHWNIAVKELLPIVVAAMIWGHLWRGRQVMVRCDNAVVVAVVNSRYSKDRRMMHLLRCVFFAEAYNNFKLAAVHLPATQNVLADDLSRDRLHSFRARFPASDASPSSIPSSLQQWLSRTDLDWTSPDWIQLFSTTVARVYPSTQQTYQSALNQFYAFCSLFNVTSPFPVSEEILCYFSSYLNTQHVSPPSIRTYLAGIRHTQVILGLSEPCSFSSLPRLHLVQAGIQQAHLE